MTPGKADRKDDAGKARRNAGSGQKKGAGRTAAAGRPSEPRATAGRATGGPATPPPEQVFAAAPAGSREWVSFDDPDEERTWVFDVTFLLSGWQCIFGHGCQGVLTGPAEELAQGCCSYGAHFTDGDDVARVKAAARQLTEDEWQFARAGRRGGVVRTDADGSLTTRLVGGACIFLNRPGFPTGAGCALHQAAWARGLSPMALKPDVCWQLPLRREDSSDDAGRVVSTVTQWDRVHWGEGGQEFHWWCTEAGEAFGSAAPVYQTLAEELTAMIGPAVYRELVAYLGARRSSGVPLPHPSVRPRRPDPPEGA